MPSIPESLDSKDPQFTGYIHLAISTGSKEKVEHLIAQLKVDGYKIMDCKATQVTDATSA